MKFTRLALLSAVTLAAAQHNNHGHRHPARHGSPVEARDVAAVTETVPGPIVTVYELNGVDISYDEVEQGLKDGKYVLVGDSISTVIPATTSSTSTTSSTPTPTPTTSSSSEAAAEFFQKPSSTSTTSEAPSPPPAASPTPAPAPAPAPSSGGSSSSDGNWPDFPSNSISCSNFPSEYGAVNLDYLGFGGWSGVQYTSSFSGDLAAGSAIVNIATAVKGQGCKAGAFCSYACPPGYQKIQWPKSQGSSGESIGGLFCNSNGLLELTRDGVSQLCGAGAGGVEVKNSLSKNVAICRTDYPGTEAETVPLNTQPGQTYPLTNPISADYYTWEGSATTAQYYVNPSGADVSDACWWNSPGSNLGNYAPANIGVGVGAGGITYISMFPNHPSNPDGTLDYNIKITGNGLIGDCEYTNGAYYSNGAAQPNGCTVSLDVFHSVRLCLT